MPSDWFVVRSGKEHGPVTAAKLKQMAATGELRPGDAVRREDMKAPVKASAVKGLFPNGQPVLAQPVSGGKIDKAVPLDNLRRRLTAFAATIPHHDIQNLGDEITVVAACRLPVFRVEWTTLFERRAVVGRERPYDGTMTIPRRAVDHRAFDAWGEVLPPVTSFKASEVEAPVEASRQVRDCDQCAVTGSVTCEGCQGHQSVCCASCGGAGTQTCAACSGTRMAREGRTVQKQRRCPGVPLVAPCVGGRSRGGLMGVMDAACNTVPDICRVCNGTGVQIYDDVEYYPVPCAACAVQGVVCCQQCAGNGAVPCPNCGGQGRLACSTCQGHKRLVKYVAVVRSLEPKTAVSVVPTKGCPEACQRELTDPEFKEVVRRASFGSDLDLSLDGDTRLITAEVQAVRDGLRTQGVDGSRPAGDRLQISRADVYRLDYSFNGVQFTAWFSGKDGPVHAPINPVTSSLTQLVEEALQAWGDGQQDDAVLALKKALQMAKADAACARTLKPLKSCIPDDLMRRASSFSFRFWYRHLSPGAKSAVTIGSAVALVSLLLCCGGFGVLSIFFQREREATKRELAEADGLWDSEDKAGAVAKYRGILQSSKRSTLNENEAAPVYGRVIDFDIENGDPDSARRLIDQAMKMKVTPLVNHPQAKEMLARAKSGTPLAQSEPKVPARAEHQPDPPPNPPLRPSDPPQPPPEKQPEPAGVVEPGNVALASRGATVVGPQRGSEFMLDGRIEDGQYAKLPLNQPCVVTLPKVYRLQAIAIRFPDFNNRFYRYKLEVSVDGRSYDVVADRTTGEWRGWQRISFPERPVMAIRLTGTHNSETTSFYVVELEAYCVPPK